MEDLGGTRVPLFQDKHPNDHTTHHPNFILRVTAVAVGTTACRHSHRKQRRGAGQYFLSAEATGGLRTWCLDVYYGYIM